MLPTDDDFVYVDALADELPDDLTHFLRATTYWRGLDGRPLVSLEAVRELLAGGGQ